MSAPARFVLTVDEIFAKSSQMALTEWACLEASGRVPDLMEIYTQNADFSRILGRGVLPEIKKSSSVTSLQVTKN